MEHIEKQETQAIIEIKNLKKVFKVKDGQVNALDDINLKIGQGEIYGIIGMSGAGKSTLVRCINLLEKPTSGQVFIDKKDISAIEEKELRTVRYSLGMIFQQFNLLSQRTAEQNILFPLEIAGVDKETAKKRTAELLSLVGLADKAKAYPSQLSGGQKQRIAIARALANNPKILLCDEATSALDPSTTKAILKLLKEINEKLGITIVIITHEMSVVEEICTHVAIIDKSHIAEEGTVEEVFRNPQTEIARKMILPERDDVQTDLADQAYRLVFDEHSSSEAVIAKMVVETKCLVNILHAELQNIEGVSYGQMVVQFGDDDRGRDKAISYLKANQILVEEVK
ncbi:MAG: D-methionine transport system ATP-binding protein [Eubacteriaceae bacterium]|nr:D-methionine transport system ATP-binding protein [Eubacteriaceae bacterium]MDK2937329.1 D-methionine transport system ATP-binding protein [Eubacteriaceae bacterium]MDN5307910.1 D-methionine transport system ATP-binding protein [Eubacteriaceae bacterium]